LTVSVVGELVAFVALSAVVICTPGPDTALTVRNAILGGRGAGVLTAAGVVTGQAVWTVAASVGLASLLSASEPAFLVVKLAGTAYLCYLGLQSLRGAWTGARAGQDRPARRVHRSRAVRQGVLNDLGNPKMAAFFISVLPQFAPFGRGGAGDPAGPRAAVLRPDVRLAGRLQRRDRPDAEVAGPGPGAPSARRRARRRPSSSASESASR
jgi:threonine/homoserine/homoserine lactone efflux protein